MDIFPNTIRHYQNEDIYLIFYVNSCPYCRNALDLLKSKNKAHNGYDINNICDKYNTEFTNIIKSIQDANIFDTKHSTKPLIFHKGKYIGGYNDLVNFIKNY